MTFIRMGVACGVINEQREILLSRRGDLDVWNLPSGRLDAGETLEEAAVREVREETGLEVALERPLGLYYHQGWQRLNVLFLARPAGGELKQVTYETRGSAFYSLSDLPENRIDRRMIGDALAPESHLFQVELPDPDEQKRLRRKLAWRWVKNLLSGHPEPRYPRFTVHASLAVRDEHGNVLSLVNENGLRVLPGIECSGKSPPWEQIRKYVRDHYDIYEMRQAQLWWTGLFEDVASRRIEFIFATRLHPGSPLTLNNLQWIPAQSQTWWYGYKPYLKHLVSEHPDDILTLHHLPEENTP